MTDIECILACPEHGDIYNVRRVPTGREGSFKNEIVPIGGGDVVSSAQVCPACSEPLVRKDPAHAP